MIKDYLLSFRRRKALSSSRQRPSTGRAGARPGDPRRCCKGGAACELALPPLARPRPAAYSCVMLPSAARGTRAQWPCFTVRQQTICSAQMGRYSLRGLQAHAAGWSRAPSPEVLVQRHHQPRVRADSPQTPARQGSQEKKSLMTPSNRSPL